MVQRVSEKDLDAWKEEQRTKQRRLELKQEIIEDAPDMEAAIPPFVNDPTFAPEW